MHILGKQKLRRHLVPLDFTLSKLLIYVRYTL